MDLQNMVEEVWNSLADQRGAGKVADYIPALAEVDPNCFGIALATRDGRTYCAGDGEVPFSIQSISKVFVLAMALDRHGSALFEAVGREPSGDPFNSIVQLEREKGIPRNPFINAGAIVTTDRLIDDRSTEEAVEELLAALKKMARDDDIRIDKEVAQSESRTGARNRSLAYFMADFDRLLNPVETVLSVYFRQCALTMTCKQLAEAALFLAFDGTDPVTGHVLTSTQRARRINALMLTCGHYDNSGEFAYEVGFCGKSGVGGGILAIVPDKASIAVWAPGLNREGTSLLGARALREIAHRTGWSVFG
ncbi:glutaminase [Pacificimonas flava]|uniref:Glutaminase n=2 Tax=Pacificimonas TaxID=1960290 RepID=A0A219B4X5_9SPHN|nr:MULTISPECIES: glutaminase [Pacificimonas]MBZ6379478.1 glutaminase [Pacificimonas aurantium]OWV33331.1 glutaminase [Pacificimonas flava]